MNSAGLRSNFYSKLILGIYIFLMKKRISVVRQVANMWSFSLEIIGKNHISHNTCQIHYINDAGLSTLPG
jgi:hypothetical protein